MTADELLDALALPPASRVDRRVPKAMLVEHGAPTQRDRRRIAEGIEEVSWVAALKPTTIGVPAFRDIVRDYLEIAVIRATLRPVAGAARLATLIHRAIPYPTVLVTSQGGATALSLAHVRRSHGDASRTVLDGESLSAAPDRALPAQVLDRFRAALSLARQPRADLHALYQGWVDAVLALNAARITGTFVVFATADAANARRAALRKCAQLDVEIARRRAAAAHERQVARQVELNLELRRLERERSQALQDL